MAVANTSTGSLYDYYRGKFCKEKGQTAIDWIDSAVLQHGLSLFPCACYGVITSNTIAIVFSAFKKVKHLLYLHIFLFIEQYIRENCFQKYTMYKELIEEGKPTFTK
jgi:hypothetical protein